MPKTTRRRFIGTTAALTAATAAATQVIEPSVAPSGTVDAQSAAGTPSPELIALNRMAFGPRPGDLERVRSMGLAAYIEEQLNPERIDDSACEQRVRNARVRIRYPADREGRYPAKDELRALEALDKTVPQLWSLGNFGIAMDFSERMRPFQDVRTATWIRAVYSRRQLQEVLVDFWHNHFNVNASGSASISAAFPVYDREVVRANCMGNFRTFLGTVASSTAMLLYLNNASNRAGGGEGGNENYARELIELHTLGSDNYLKFYDDRRKVGVIDAGGKQFARGYIDEDVYEAARCFTGWSLANGRNGRPDTGQFFYDSSWHDVNPKTFLWKPTDGPSNIPGKQPDLKDGRDVLDLLSQHPGTARFVCTKLCRRLIADNPPAGVIDAAVKTWMDNLSAPDQIRRVVRTILSSNEFRATWGAKIKRPFEFAVAFLRATNAELRNDDMADGGNRWDNLVRIVGDTGHRLFEWPTPTGYPDVREHWLSTNGMLRRWNIPYIMTQRWGGDIGLDLRAQTNMNSSCTQIVDAWITRLVGYSINPTARQEIINFLAQGGDVNRPPRPTDGAPDWKDDKALTERISSVVQLIASTPEFQMR